MTPWPWWALIYIYRNSNWSDQQTTTYDAIFNPLPDGTWEYTWEHGRQLASMTNGTKTWTYGYDADGMRYSRSDGTTTWQYIYIGSQLAYMQGGGNYMYFQYDANGTPVSVAHNGTYYYYVTNLQGDIIALLDTSGNTVTEYTYDAWGKLLTTTGSKASTVGAVNPLRYRGYVYDTDTGLYYLQSRYYDPEIGRFINADALVSTGQGLLGNNMFAYCRNNPVVRVDIAGTADKDCFDTDPFDNEDLERLRDGIGGSGGAASTTSSSGDYSGGGHSSGNSSPTSVSLNSGSTSNKNTLYRAVSSSEYVSTTQNQMFSAGPNSYSEGKYFATTHSDATQWGNAMYPQGDYKIMTAEFDSGVLTSGSIMYWPRLDSIGPAYYIGISDTNFYVTAIY